MLFIHKTICCSWRNLSFLCPVISQGKAVALVRWGGKWNHLSMTRGLTTDYAKNYCNRTVIDSFLGHTVYVLTSGTSGPFAIAGVLVILCRRIKNIAPAMKLYYYCWSRSALISISIVSDKWPFRIVTSNPILNLTRINTAHNVSLFIYSISSVNSN